MLNNSYNELKKAKRYLDRMVKCDSFEEFEENWTNFLSSLEKVWNKSERECQLFSKKFQPWQGRFKSIRKSDQVLSYLKNARDADTHSIQEIIQKKSGSIGISGTDKSKPLILTDVKIDGFGNISIKESNQDLDIKIEKPRFIVKPFRNSGVTYFPPLYYRTQKLSDPLNPTEIAKNGYEFYETYLNELSIKIKEWSSI